MSSPVTPPAELVARLNAGAPTEAARWIYEGAIPFGDLTTTAASELPQVHRFRLGNGLRLLLLVDQAAPVVSYFTWFRVGSRHEKPGKTGLAHLFEHLMFNETQGLKAGEFDRKLEESGAESNAATWFDWTYYYEALPKDRFGLAVELESERMARLVLREPQVVSEKEVVTNERRMRVEDDPEGTANEILYKTAFTKHPYHWPTIGWMDDIQGFTPSDCEAFYATYYAPNNATVVVVGDVTEEDVLTRVRDGQSIDVMRYTALVDRLHSLLKTIGIRRTARRVSLADILAQQNPPPPPARSAVPVQHEADPPAGGGDPE